MKKLIAKTKIKRESGCLYYTKTDENGFVTLWKSDRKKEQKKEDENER